MRVAEGVDRVRVVSCSAVTITVEALPAVSVTVSAKGRVALTKLAALTVAVRVRHCRDRVRVEGSQPSTHQASYLGRACRIPSMPDRQLVLTLGAQKTTLDVGEV